MDSTYSMSCMDCLGLHRSYGYHRLVSVTTPFGVAVKVGRAGTVGRERVGRGRRDVGPAKSREQERGARQVDAFYSDLYVSTFIPCVRCIPSDPYVITITPCVLDVICVSERELHM